MKCIQCDRVAEEVGTGWRCQFCGIRFWNDSFPRKRLLRFEEIGEKKEDVGDAEDKITD